MNVDELGHPREGEEGQATTSFARLAISLTLPASVGWVLEGTLTAAVGSLRKGLRLNS